MGCWAGCLGKLRHTQGWAAGGRGAGPCLGSISSSRVFGGFSVEILPRSKEQQHFLQPPLLHRSYPFLASPIIGAQPTRIPWSPLAPSILLILLPAILGWAFGSAAWKLS